MRVLIILLSCLLFSPCSLFATASYPRFKSDEVLVKFKYDQESPDKLIRELNQSFVNNTSSVGVKVEPKLFTIQKLSSGSAFFFANSLNCMSLSAKVRALTALSELNRLYSIRFGDSVSINQVLESLRRTDLLEVAQPNYLYYKKVQAVPTPNDPAYSQIYRADLFGLNMTQAWDFSSSVYSPVVGVIDTGLDYAHGDLAPVMWNDGAGHIGYDAVDGSLDPMDYDGHGTHVSGLIGAAFNNGLGSLGIATHIRLAGLKVMDPSGYISTAYMVDAIKFAIGHGFNVLNMSLGGDEFDTVLKNTCDQAYAANILLLAAAGNEAGPVNYPAAFSSVMAIGALNSTFDDYAKPSDWGYDPDSGAPYGSNYGPQLSVIAPGTAILSTMAKVHIDYGVPVNLNDTFIYMRLTGTSQACPIVAGLAALILQTYPEYSATQVRALIENSADDMGGSGKDNYFGYGRINPVRAMMMADNVPPTIQLSTKNVYPPNTSITISTSIFDNISPVLTENITATLYWKTDTQSVYTGVPLSRGGVSSSVFNGILPSQNVELTLNYFIVAKDLNFNSATSEVKNIFTFDHRAPVITNLSKTNYFPGKVLNFFIEDDSAIAHVSVTLNNSVGSTIATYRFPDEGVVAEGQYFRFSFPESLAQGGYHVWVDATDILGNSSVGHDYGPIYVNADFQFIGPTDSVSIPLAAPNPFNPSKSELIIGFRLSRMAQVEFSIFDLNGNKVFGNTLDTPLDPIDMYYEQKWNGRDSSGSRVKNGIYLIYIKAISDLQHLIHKIKLAVVG